MTKISTRRLELGNGLGLRVEERGRDHGGVPVLLVHGFTGSVEAWGDDVPTGLARSRRVLAVDLPGHGASELPEEEGGMRMEEVVRALGAVLDDAGAPEAVWVGYSMGGRLALGAAVLEPDRVEGLVVESASPGLASEEERRDRRSEDEALADEIEARGIEWFVDMWMDKPLFATQKRLPLNVREDQRRRRLTASPAGLARTLRELGTGAQPSFWERLAEIDVPVLVLTGEEDAKFCRIGDAMASRLRRVVRRTVPGAGHCVHLEAPDAWLDAVTGFLATDASEPR